MNNQELNLAQVISMTSRARRESERDGIHYDFVTREYFEEAIKELEKHVTNVPKEIVELAFGEGTNVKDTMTFESCYKLASKLIQSIYQQTNF